MFLRVILFLGIFLLSLFKINICNNAKSGDRDPFLALNIPNLDPKAMLKEIEQEQDKTKPKGPVKLKSIEDLPNFLKNSNMNEEESVKILTRFLIQDDYMLKKKGVVYDQTGFDGLSPNEKPAAIGTEERLIQRAKSSANIWVK